MRMSGRAGVAIAIALGLVALVPVAAQDDQGSVVVTRPGVVFHKAGAEDIRGRGQEKTIEAAMEAGYQPCPICFGKQVSTARNLGPDLASGMTMPRFGTADIPAPPATTIVQPFGRRTLSVKTGGLEEDIMRNPYEQASTILFAGWEQGAFETH